MFIIAGLGNPGKDHCNDRHNIGFIALDYIHSFYSFSEWKNKFCAEISNGNLNGTRTILIKPQTFMNLSGNSIIEVINFYKILLRDCLIIHDELDLKMGKLRIKIGGRDAGHNGLKSISERCGRDYKRLRIGIGRPQNKEHIAKYVLNSFSSEEKSLLDPILNNIAKYIYLLAKNEDTLFLNHISQKQDHNPIKTQ
ncbi:MAG: aminoacyl-tRNA hydrolase [Candidatus Liberibacter europaeus]|uniref:Peptidyl-tRNA hydrolase n=1 Tax=Candidatus Liberibacter europaeus TaxID=744859 RepID=A0A2T4VYJ2_9HYPH|nr:aminoacyl-tRNA hydrolase [Candidatus Liberibacter europaeus]PTL86852.1 MAG: aminoacyl-tRNA hydrolase [Candidatus Liberibacter europaeus]